MKPMTLALVALSLLTMPPLLAHHDGPAAGSPAAPDAAWLAKAKADYPLKTCVVSEEEIGGPMGPGIDYIYHQEGQPDRLVRFCCKNCRKDFDKDPHRYLKLIDEAAAHAQKH